VNPPAALAKAESLYQFAQSQGAPLKEFLVTVTDAEAAELLEWYAEQHEGQNELFDLDLAEARRTQNPWPILEHFNLKGLTIAPTAVLQ
jgi:hypothetical protein